MKNKMKLIFNKNFIVKWLLLAVIMAFINGIVFCNLSTCTWGKYEEKQLDLSKLGKESVNASLQPDGSLHFGSAGGFAEFTDVGCEVKSVTLVCQPLHEKIMSGIIYCKDEGNAYRYSQNQTFDINMDYGTITKAMHSQGKCSSIKLYVESNEAGLFIKEVIVNKKEPFRFRFGTYLIMLLIGSLCFFLKELDLLQVRMNLADKRQRLWLAFGILVPVGLSLFISLASLRQGETLLYPYEEGNVADMPMQQMMLFDSFLHGSVRLNLDVDPDYLLLDNVYDESERLEKGFDSEWDMAFYNGSYYSYFGGLPIIVLYGICYLLTGCLPGINFSMFIASVLGIIGFFAATYWMLKYYKLVPSLFAYILGNWTLMTASFFFIISVNSDQYTLPIISSLAFVQFGIAFAYAAVQAQGSVKRVVRYVLSGISLVCVVMLRPTVLLMLLAFILPLYIGVLLDKELTVKKKCRDVVAFAVPVLLGAVVVMVYNWLRFDSPFEFGARYQLTVSDIRYNGVTWDFNNLFGAIYHYGFEGPDFKAKFPFLFYSQDSSITYGKYVYHEALMGVFCMPFNLLAFGILTLGKEFRKKKQEWMTLVTIFVVSFVMMIFDFGMGGLVARYAGDFAIGFAFLAFWIWMRIDVSESEVCLKAKRIVCILSAVTLVMGFLLLFSNDPIKYQIARENPNIYMFFANLFDI